MLVFQIFDSPDMDNELADFSARVHPEVGGGGLRFGTNEHGFAALEAPLVPMGLQEAFSVYDWPGLPHVVVSGRATGVAWVGRLEDKAIVPGGVQLGAFGYWRATSDIPNTVLFSDTSTSRWRAVTGDEYVKSAPSKYNIDTNNRVYASMKKNQTYINDGAGNSRAMIAYWVPHNGGRNLQDITYTYDVTLPTGWTMRIVTYAEGFTSGVVDRTITGNGASQTGTETITLSSGKQIVTLDVRNNSGGGFTNTAEDDAWFVKLTNIRVKTMAGSITADKIASGQVGFVNSINPSQLGSSAALIEATSEDLQDELYEDVYPADILTDLANLHNYEVGVWDDQRLHFRPRGSAGRDFYVDVTRILNLQNSLANMYNSAYGRFRDANGRILRTAVANDSTSQNRFGIVRRGFVDAQTTSQTQAEAHRDAWLTDKKNYVVRAEIEFERLEDENGGEHSLHEVRQGDTVTMRNLPPVLSPEIDNLRKFVVGETEFNVIANQMHATPREGVPTLVSLVARREAGL